MFLPRFAQWLECRSALAVVPELLRDGFRFVMTITRSRAALGAEVLFLRKQLAYYQEHEIRPRLTDAARLSLVLWSCLFNWREALAIVGTATFIGWYRKGFKVLLALEITGRKAQRLSATKTEFIALQKAA